MPIPRIIRFSIITLCVVLLFFGMHQVTKADELDDLTKQIKELTESLNASVAATKPLESELVSMQQRVKNIKQQVFVLEGDIAEKKEEIEKGYAHLSDKEVLLRKTIRSFYINSHHNSPLLTLFSAKNASAVTQALAYQKAKTDQDKSLIINLAISISELEEKKKQLNDEQKRLVAVKSSLDAQSAKLDEVIKGAKAYQTTLSSQIATLSAKQQEIINARSGSFTASIGDSDEADDVNASIKGFRENAPSGSFAVFSFGAYTHRKGMSQYGAYARAKAGQSAKDILKAYYGKEPVSKDTGGTIKVSGHGEIDFEGRYLMGIAEMPSSWHPEALKAQAIAARTYAYRYKAQGSEICTTEACQVYSSSKADNVPDSWKKAIEETRGQVLEDVVTYYASTSGGYLTTMGWDTTDGQGGPTFADRAYEKLAGSPWFYKAWYTKGYSVSSDKCGRSNAWLSSEEMADFVNAAIVMQQGSSEETKRVTPVTTSCWGGSPYSHDELRSVAEKYGGGARSVSGVTVSQGNGNTNEVTFQTDKGEKRFSGSNFKTAFNLRAPGYLAIPQSGFAFFNIEKK